MAVKSNLRKDTARVFDSIKELIEHPQLQREGENRRDEVLKGVFDALLSCASTEDIVVCLGSAITDKVMDGQEPHLDPQTGKKLARMDVIAQRLYRSVVEGF